MASKSRPKKGTSGKVSSSGDSKAERLPFEPKKSKARPTSEVQTPEAVTAAVDPKISAAKAKADEIMAASQAAKRARQGKATDVNSSKSSAKSSAGKGSTTIPEAVSKRMFGRMVVFSGIPSLLGLMIFPISYLIVTQHWFELPNAVVVVLSLGMFGLGALGLTYGVLSASWDEGNSGSALGWQEFQTNWGRVTEGWRTRKQQNSSS
jgi:hypothetical protein